jgi:hypothetical protein
MTVLPNIDVFEKYISNTRDKIFIDVNNIFFNDCVDILLTSNYLDCLESKLSNFEIIQALTVELSDKNRISKNTIDNSEENIVEKLYEENVEKIDCLFAISLNTELNVIHYNHSKQCSTSKNKDYILFKLLTANFVSLHYFDFVDDSAIEKLFTDLFDLPPKLSRISVYNRYSEYNYLTVVKNKSIQYYNLIRGNSYQKRLEFIAIEQELKRHLGPNVVLKSTSNTSAIHERKIFFNHFVITVDQALNCLKTNEPNWKLDIEIDRKKCFNEWSKKEHFFRRIN